MNARLHFRSAGLPVVWLAMLTAAASGQAQTYYPYNWVNDPFCFNPNYGIVAAQTPSPVFTNNGVQRGTLYANSPIGATLKLSQPGDTISFTGQMALTGDINPDGDMQFRVGLYHQGSNPTDTNWLGYTIGNPAGGGSGAGTGLFVRNNPNSGVYASGSTANATRPEVLLQSYNAGWTAGTYEFSLTISLLESNLHQISWRLKGLPPGAYNYAASYRNTNSATAPPSFDQVGIMGGAALFNSASTANRLSFSNLTVTLGR